MVDSSVGVAAGMNFSLHSFQAWVPVPGSNVQSDAGIAGTTDALHKINKTPNARCNAAFAAAGR